MDFETSRTASLANCLSGRPAHRSSLAPTACALLGRPWAAVCGGGGGGGGGPQPPAVVCCSLAAAAAWRPSCTAASGRAASFTLRAAAVAAAVAVAGAAALAARAAGTPAKAVCMCRSQAEQA
ncbi:hypothetical protein CHLRE_02g142046v5 [Chlamydomonas reinhardtii]|uniref:Uncharacterized protein n=1 Tax=Chlamydomonas reinhardtii TaxID=3055 RepID=A0A2K3E4C9_CHLRE|nr:uncharacterized protein CHLRE_02g142046v5 [Chlamydomonas reinhardtii]PNW87641.1 hypothetical protein CHLRE_02g142046v5 [Chlamydomonas reinhardtii]